MEVVLLGLIKLEGDRLIRDLGVDACEERGVNVLKSEVSASAGALERKTFQCFDAGCLSKNIGGRVVIVVEGIRSSNGTKIEYIDRFLRLHKPEEIVYATLARQRGSGKGPIHLETWGFEIEDDEYIVGYGLDLDERYRNLPFVGICLEHDVAGRTG